MSGTIAGGKKAAKTNQERHGADYYKKIGAKGGKLGKTGGFYYMKYTKGNFEAIAAAGRKGGSSSSRLGIKNGEGQQADTTDLEAILHYEKPKLFSKFKRKKV